VNQEKPMVLSLKRTGTRGRRPSENKKYQRKKRPRKKIAEKDNAPWSTNEKNKVSTTERLPGQFSLKKKENKRKKMLSLVT